jgi:SAM-dependent methyltransferase
LDKWKFFDITHRKHLICNPTNSAKLETLVGLVALEPGARVLDIACGKGEFILRLADRYDIEGVGVDLSPYVIADAKRKQRLQLPKTRVSFLEMDGADYEPEAPESFDLVACIGASWIYGGYRGTLEALSGMAGRASWVVVGEPFWLQEPAEAYLQAIGEKRGHYGTHYENGMAGSDLGLSLAYSLVSSQDDWDMYEGLQWAAAEEWAAANPEDPDRVELLERVHADREAFLHWGRETLGWAIYLFRKGR